MLIIKFMADRLSVLFPCHYSVTKKITSAACCIQVSCSVKRADSFFCQPLTRPLHSYSSSSELALGANNLWLGVTYPARFLRCVETCGEAD